MINDDLLSKFDRLEDLPVSEELLGAYLEGTLDSFESANIESDISSDSHLSSFVESIAYDDVASVLDNLEHQLFDSSYPALMSDIQMPDLYGEAVGLSIYEKHMAACDPYGLSETVNDDTSNDLSLSANMLEENFSNEDSFSDSDQSLDIESYNNDDMFNEDTIDM